MKLSFPSPEKSLCSFDSLGMMDHSNVNLYKQDTLNAAFDNMESFMGHQSVSESHKQDKHKLWPECAGHAREGPVGRNNGGAVLIAKSDKNREVGVDGRFREVHKLWDEGGMGGASTGNKENGHMDAEKLRKSE